MPKLWHRTKKSSTTSDNEPDPGEAWADLQLQRMESLAQLHGTLPIEEALVAARKSCSSCGEEIEMLRYRCPRCSSEMFIFYPWWGVIFPELVEVAQTRQLLASERVDRGSLLFKQGMADEALQEFHQAIKVNPWNATAHANIGLVYFRRGQLKEALRWWERALEIDPHVGGVTEMVERVRRELR